MIRQAIASDDPVMFFEPKRRYWQKGEVDEELVGEPLDAARVVRPGTDVTLVAYGPLVTTASEAATAAEDEGISIEVIDLRSLSPVDYDVIEQSVNRTGHLVIVHEASGNLGLGAEIAATITDRCFYSLEAPPARVTGWDVPYPPAKLEHHFLPNLDRILDAVDRVLGRENSLDGVAAMKDFLLPDLGEGLTESELLEWHVAVGDTVTINQTLAEVETAKAIVQLPSPFAGVVAKLYAEPGTTVPVGAPIVGFETEDADAPAAPPTPHPGARGLRPRGRDGCTPQARPPQDCVSRA